MRHKDLHILSVGRLMYSSDNRYEIVHRENTNEFQLHIHHLKSTDEGVYECQVSTKPITAFYINLKVTKGGKNPDFTRRGAEIFTNLLLFLLTKV